MRRLCRPCKCLARTGKEIDLRSFSLEYLEEKVGWLGVCLRGIF